MFNVGSKMKNGAIVLACKLSTKGYPVVLVLWTNGPGSETSTPFVTWAVDPEGNAYWGHYFGNIVRAVKDFEER